MKPICVKCQRFFKIERNGVRFIEAMPGNGNPVAGTFEAHNWTPYKLWLGDLWKCPDCGAQTISGVGLQPISEHFHENFAELAKDASIVVNDC